MKYSKLLKEWRILLVLAAIVVACILIITVGLHFGLEFEGGVRIPLSFEKPVDQLTMSDIVNTIKTRVTKFGMSQVVVTGIGNSEVYVEVPKGDMSQVQEIENILQQQGNFEGIVDGKVAVSGADLMPGSIITSQPTIQGTDVKWAVSFAITQEAARKFASVVYGKSDFPVYMFLDRPGSSIVLIKRSDLLYGNLTISETEAIKILEGAARKENDSIPIFIEDDFSLENKTIASLNTTKKSVILSQEADPAVVKELQKMNYEIVNKTPDDMRPGFYSAGDQGMKLNGWGAIDLLSAPVLSKDITEGRVNQFYEVNGFAPRQLTYEQKQAAALAESKKLKSILSGGALPVRISIGTSTTIPPSLGTDFLNYSIIGALLSASVISFLIFLRYREPRIVIPIILTILLEMALTLSVVGTVLGTIDVGVMAGVIGATGTGVNDQIVITDEVLSGRKEYGGEERGVKIGIARAFFIVLVGASVAIIALVPLLFSGLVEIIGFALSGIIEVLISTAITRPAFAKFIEEMFEK
jgi:preprotein translocase subunit SecD